MVDFMDSPQYQDLMDNFNMDSKKINKNGDTTRNWVCKFSKKKKGFNCPVKSRTVQTIEKVTVFKVEEASHEHEPVENSTRKNFDFSVEAQSKMKELLQLNVNSRNIRKALIDKGIYTEETAPSTQGFYNKTSQLRKKMNLDRKNIGLGELEDLIENNSEEPEDPTDPYVIKHVVEEDETGRLRFSILFSSKDLIDKYLKSGKRWMLSLDSTYQTNTEDCPLIFFGSSNKDGKFNGIGAILSNREDKKAFDFLFDYVKNTAEPLPTAVMADADKAITSSVRDILPGSKRLTCFFHIMKNVRQRLSRVKTTDKAIYNKIMEDIRILQAGAVDEESFSILYSLLTKKWMVEHEFYDPELKIMVSEFFAYFTKVMAFIYSKQQS